MRTYKEHYNYCKGLYNIKSEKYNTLYDLRVDNSFLNEVIDTKYYSLIETIRTKIDEKIKSNKGVFQDKHAIRVNDWYDIKELEDLVKIFMPVVERNILGCNGKIEFLHPYRNLVLDGQEESSWTWHYDDCPDEFLKFFINLNEVTENSGCLKYLQSKDGSVPIVKTFNTVAGIRSTAPPIYERSRVPNNVVESELEEGGQIINVTGPAGSYAICTPNIIHRASCPDIGTVPRDVLFFFIRPSIKKYDNYLEDTNSYRPAKNVKMYNLD
jgi:hypothetical protein